jgi:hypothetical protein
MKNFFRPIFDVDEEICPRGQRAPRPPKNGCVRRDPPDAAKAIRRRAQAQRCAIWHVVGSGHWGAIAIARSKRQPQ